MKIYSAPITYTGAVQKSWKRQSALKAKLKK